MIQNLFKYIREQISETFSFTWAVIKKGVLLTIIFLNIVANIFQNAYLQHKKL